MSQAAKKRLMLLCMAVAFSTAATAADQRHALHAHATQCQQITALINSG